MANTNVIYSELKDDYKPYFKLGDLIRKFETHDGEQGLIRVNTGEYPDNIAYVFYPYSFLEGHSLYGEQYYLKTPKPIVDRE